MKIYKPNGKCNISGNNIRVARENLGLSQEQLAAKLQVMELDITQKTISRMETGLRVIADYELEYLAKSLNLTVYSLLGINESPTK